MNGLEKQLESEVQQPQQPNINANDKKYDFMRTSFYHFSKQDMKILRKNGNFRNKYLQSLANKGKIKIEIEDADKKIKGSK